MCGIKCRLCTTTDIAESVVRGSCTLKISFEMLRLFHIGVHTFAMCIGNTYPSNINSVLLYCSYWFVYVYIYSTLAFPLLYLHFSNPYLVSWSLQLYDGTIFMLSFGCAVPSRRFQFVLVDRQFL